MKAGKPAFLVRTYHTGRYPYGKLLFYSMGRCPTPLLFLKEKKQKIKPFHSIAKQHLAICVSK